MPRPSIPLARCHEIAAWFTAEKTYVQAAIHFGMDTDSVRRALRRIGAFKSRARGCYTAEERDQIKTMLEQGGTAQAIADALGRPYHGLQRYLSDNFTNRKQGRPAKKITVRPVKNAINWLSRPLMENV